MNEDKLLGPFFIKEEKNDYKSDNKIIEIIKNKVISYLYSDVLKYLGSEKIKKIFNFKLKTFSQIIKEFNKNNVKFINIFSEELYILIKEKEKNSE